MTIVINPLLIATETIPEFFQPCRGSGDTDCVVNFKLRKQVLVDITS